MNQEHFTNAVHNNWHSWGLIIKDANKKLQVLKECPESGENNPEMLWKLLEDNIDCERFMHLRHTTKGETNMQNTQPFPVFSDNNREVYFMHNGTLYQYGQSANIPGAKSDTLDFCEKVLVPTLSRWTGPNGVADYLDRAYWDFILKNPWVDSSKGLFVSNDLDPLTIGNGWVNYTLGEGKILSSNDTYFERVTRGPEHERREKARKEALAKTQPSFPNSQGEAPWNEDTSTTSDTTNGKVNSIKIYGPARLEKSDTVLTCLKHMYEDFNFDDAGQLIQGLFHVTREEFVELCKEEDPELIAMIFEQFSNKSYELYLKYLDLERKMARKDKRLTEIFIANPHLKEEDKAA